MTTTRSAAAWFLVAALVACSGGGGGGGGGGNAVEPPGPALSLSTSSVILASAQTGAPLPVQQLVSVTNSGGGTLVLPSLSITYDSGSGWLDASVAPAGGGYAITLRPNTTLLAPGAYAARVQVASAGATGSPRTIAVAWQVTAIPGPALVVSPASLEFTGQIGGSDPAPQELELSNVGGGALAAASVSADAAWLDASVVGSVVTVQVALGALPAGDHTASVSVTSAGAAGSPRSVPVTFHVLQPRLSASPTLLSFVAPMSRSPAAQVVTVSNSGTGTLGTVTATPSYDGGIGWMSATVSGAGNTRTVTVRVTAPATEATFQGTLVIASPGASGSPVSITVSVTSTPAIDTSTPSAGASAVAAAFREASRSCFHVSDWVDATTRADDDAWAADFGSAVTAGRASYSEEEAAACVMAVQAATCEEVGFGPPAPSCTAWHGGLVATGNACSDAVECAAGWCAFDATCPGTCTAFSAGGSGCSRDVECGSGSFCDPDLSACAAKPPPAAEGAPCAAGWPECALGLYCDRTGTPTCVPKLWAGEACVAFDACRAGLDCGGSPRQCRLIVGSGGASCAAYICPWGFYCSASAGTTCRVAPVAGQSCSDPGSTMYGGTLLCIDYSYCLGTTTKTCTAGTAAPGGTCDPLPTSSSSASSLCQPGDRCAYDAGAGGYRCVRDFTSCY